MAAPARGKEAHDGGAEFILRFSLALSLVVISLELFFGLKCGWRASVALKRAALCGLISFFLFSGGFHLGRWLFGKAGEDTGQSEGKR